MDGTDAVVNSLVRWCTQDIYLQIEGVEPLPLSPAARTAAIEALRAARVPNVLCGWLMAGHRLIAMVNNKQFKPHALDVSMVINFIMSSASLRTSESWAPICMPHYNSKAFARAYVTFIQDTEIGVVFLSAGHEDEQFYAISQQAAEVKLALERSGVLEDVREALAHCPVCLATSACGISSASGGAAAPGSEPSASPTGSFGTGSFSMPRERSVRRSLLAPAPAGQWRLLEGIIHAAYYIPSLQQYFTSAVKPENSTRRQVKMLFRNYGRCRNLLRGAKQPSQICIATDHECFYVSLATDFHMYLAVPRGISTGVIGQFYQWVKTQEAHIFMLQQPTW